MRLKSLPSLGAFALLVAIGCSDAPTTPTVEPGTNAVTSKLTPVDPGGGECDPWLDPTWCEDDDPGDPGEGGECLTGDPAATGSPEEDVGVHHCPPPGGGGETGDGDEPPPADTCATGDPVIDDPDVSVGLQDLWVRSNPNANLAQRVEQAGWIVQTSAGYSVIPWTGGTAGFACGDFEVQIPTTGTVVGFVHTHPYRVDETIVSCDFTNVTDYTGAPSQEDRDASVQLGQLFGIPGGLPGYIIDQDGYYRFEGQTYTATPRKPRCGY